MTLALGEPFVVEVEDRPIPPPLGNRFRDDLSIEEGFVLNGGVASVCRPKVHVILSVCGCGLVCGALPSLRNVLGTLTVCGFNALLVGAVRCNRVIPE